jgi:hypothetical protein
MAGESSSSGRGGILGGLPLWLIILLLISVVLAVLAVAALTLTFITRSDRGAVPTLAPTAALPTAISESVILPTKETDELPPTNTIEAGAILETDEPVELPPTNTIIAGALVPTYTPLSLPSRTAVPDQTDTPQSTRTSTPTRLPLPTNTRYIPPPPPATATKPATSTPLATSTPAASSNWRGEYFNNQELSGEPSLVRQDPQINFDWGTGSPAPEIQSDHFSVRWTRTLFYRSGTYTFNAFSDDGVRVWLDNQLIIDQWHDTTNVTFTAVRTISEGNHSLKVEYYENQGNAHIRFWQISGSSFPQWRGEYYNNQDLAGQPILVRNDSEINFNWGDGSPANVIPSDHFSIRWTREMGFNAGDYIFNARSDDGIRVWFDGQLIIDEWHDNDGVITYHAIRSVSSGVHSIRVDYYENIDQAFIQFSWEPVSSQPFWNGQYYSNKNLSGSPAMTRSDSSVNFFWGLGSPSSKIPDDNFSARWDRIANFSQGKYRFHATVNDGVRVFVDGNILIDSWKAGGKQSVTADKSLSGHHEIVIEYFEDVQVAEIHVWWEKIGG